MSFFRSQHWNWCSRFSRFVVIFPKYFGGIIPFLSGLFYVDFNSPVRLSVPIITDILFSLVAFRFFIFFLLHSFIYLGVKLFLFILFVVLLKSEDLYSSSVLGSCSHYLFCYVCLLLCLLLSLAAAISRSLDILTLIFLPFWFLDLLSPCDSELFPQISLPVQHSSFQLNLISCFTHPLSCFYFCDYIF